MGLFDKFKTQKYHSSADIADPDSHDFAIHILQELASKHTPVIVKFHHTKEQYASMVIEADAETESFKLDELSPTDGHDHVQVGSELDMISSDNGIGIKFNGKVLKIGSDKGIAFYEMKIPEKVTYSQRREAFRTKMSGKMDKIAIELNIGNLGCDTSKAHIQDISFSGMCIDIPHANLEGKLERGSSIDGLSFLLDDGSKFSCEFEIKRLQYDENKDHTILAGRFLHLEKEQQRSINHFVSHIQRELRRIETEEI